MANRFGNDIVLKDGDLTTSITGDLFTTDDYEKLSSPEDVKFEGYFNVLFSITNRLLTPSGDNIFHPDYGSELADLISMPNSPSLNQQIKAAVQRAIEADTRVESIQYITVEQKDRYVSIKAGVVMIGTDQAAELVFPNFIVE